MSLRLIGKAYLLARRARRRFYMFVLIYSALIAACAFSIHQAQEVDFDTTHPSFYSMIVTICLSIGTSIFYALIIMYYRTDEIATLKCLGWKNNHVRVLVSGEIFTVTFIAFVLVVEFVFHWIAISVYFAEITQANIEDTIPMGFLPIAVTFGVILGAQIGGILVINNKILQVRPIQALHMKK
ncbi:MAG: FtsX-like permease family protein [Candidatus Hodarchaeota archaeon]